tara:strand:+ start:31768 stop:32100 length:333 start_codon:yes stop_codon:yes gene_type:complete
MVALVSEIHPGDTAVMRLTGLADKDAAFVNDATVSLTDFADEITGVTVTGLTLPLAMNYVTGSDGVYEAVVSHNAAVVLRRWYVATVLAISTDGSRGTWEERVRCSKKRA